MIVRGAPARLYVILMCHARLLPRTTFFFKFAALSCISNILVTLQQTMQCTLILNRENGAEQADIGDVCMDKTAKSVIQAVRT